VAVSGNWIPRGNDAQRLGALLNQLVNYVAQARGLARILADAIEQAKGGSGSTADLATMFGIEPANTGAVADLVKNLAADLEAEGVTAILQRLA
jgi:hypothetical protein